MNTIDNEWFINSHKFISSDFTRNRKLGFKELIVCLLRFTRPGLQTELDRFYRDISDSPNNFNSISKSAFSQARQKLKPSAFISLNKELINYFEDSASYKKRWKGRRIIAIDGSIINLPTSDDILELFGKQRNNSSVTNTGAMASLAYDVENELVIDALITNVHASERDLAAQHLLNLNPDTDIILVDRGYQGHWLIALLEKMGFKYCFRIGTGWHAPITALKGQGEDIDWQVCKQAKMANKYKIPYEKYEIDGYDKFNVRLVKVDIGRDEPEILLTNLVDRNQFTTNDLKSLYHKRWGIEEGYKTLKKVLAIEHFTGKTSVSVEQDFHARILMMNIASLIASQTLPEIRHQRKQPFKVNKTQAVAKAKDFIVDLILKSDLIVTIKQVQRLIGNCLEIIRPERSFIRLPSNARHRSRGMGYKGI